ncbi:hypothetical protein HDU80_003349 [Chytriomyces hyalinus]|nr:hypothetical protein HDU80_003349 [Chytriomyces hyalinus]
MSLAAKSSDSVKGTVLVPTGTKPANAATKISASTLQSTTASAKSNPQASYAPRAGTAAGTGAPRSISIKSVKSSSGSLDSLQEKTTAAAKSTALKSQPGSSQLTSQPISANRRRASLNLAQAVAVSSAPASAIVMPDIQNSTAAHASSSISPPVSVSSSVSPVSILRTKTPPTANTNTNAGVTLATQAANLSPASQSSTGTTAPISIMRAKTPPSATMPPTPATTAATISNALNTTSTSLKSTIPSHRTKYTSSATRTLQTAPSPPTTRRSSAITMNNHTRISSGASTGAASGASAASHAARVAAAAAAASQQHRRISSSMRGNGLMSAVELQRMPAGSSTSGSSGAPSSGHSLGILTGNEMDTNGMMRVASAPVERKRITFAPDVVGGAGDDMDLIPKRVSLGLRKPVSSGSSSHAAVLADLANAASDAKSSSPHESPRASTTTTSTARADLQTIVTEQSQRIAELELKLKESERREQVAVKEKAAAVKELELNKKFMASDIKSVDQLKTQLQEEHQTNASLIIFNRSLKTQVAELEGIIEGLLAQKGASALDISAIMAKIESHKPIMPKISK